LEEYQIPSTPLEEREKREKMMTKNVENIKNLEAECTNLYEESTRVYMQLTEDMELHKIKLKLQAAKDKV
jgi:hypothetical protein